jgi:hypothetical protein
MLIQGPRLLDITVQLPGNTIEGLTDGVAIRRVDRTLPMIETGRQEGIDVIIDATQATTRQTVVQAEVGVDTVRDAVIEDVVAAPTHETVIVLAAIDL